MVLVNKFLEFNLVLFPIWVGILYLSLGSIIPNDELLFLIFLLLLGETHFASTFFFYFDPNNRSWLKANKVKMVYIPIIIILGYIILGITNLYFAAFLGSVFSAFHVTRQSVGISRIFGVTRNSFFELAVYAYSVVFLTIGFLRFFYNDIINKVDINFYEYNDNLEPLYLYLIASAIVVSLFNTRDYKKIFATITGCLIYAPYLFVSNAYDAIIIGVGAHWCQYIALSYKIYFQKNSPFSGKMFYYILFFFITYATVMALLGYKEIVNSRHLNYLILIPLSGQFFHYYVDMYIWKFSDSHIREYIGGRLFSKT